MEGEEKFLEVKDCALGSEEEAFQEGCTRNVPHFPENGDDAEDNTEEDVRRFFADCATVHSSALPPINEEENNGERCNGHLCEEAEEEGDVRSKT